MNAAYSLRPARGAALVFSRKDLGNSGLTRVIVGARAGHVVTVGIQDPAGATLGKRLLFPRDIDTLARALYHATSSRRSRTDIGSLDSGELRHPVWTCDGAIWIGRERPDGEHLGRAMAIEADEFSGLADALAWLGRFTD